MECNKDRGRRELSDPRRIVYDWDHTGMPILVSGGQAPAERNENQTDAKAHLLPARKRKAPPNPPTWTWGLIPILLDVDTRNTNPNNPKSESPAVLEANPTASSKQSSKVEVTTLFPKHMKLDKSNELEDKDERSSQDDYKTPGTMLRNPLFQECAKEESTSSWNNRGLEVLVPNPFYKPPTAPIIAIRPDHELFEQYETDEKQPAFN